MKKYPQPCTKPGAGHVCFWQAGEVCMAVTGRQESAYYGGTTVPWFQKRADVPEEVCDAKRLPPIDPGLHRHVVELRVKQAPKKLQEEVLGEGTLFGQDIS